MLQKLGTDENKTYTNLILPKKKTDEISFDETIKFLASTFHTRYKCLNLRKQEDKDFVSFAGNVNNQCERFNLKDLSSDIFKYLVFVQWLTASRDKDIRSRITNKMKQEPDINCQKWKYVNVKINGVNLKLQLDTGSNISIIIVLTWKPEALRRKKQNGSRSIRKEIKL